MTHSLGGASGVVCFCQGKVGTYLLQVTLHAGHQHDAGHTHAQQQEACVDEASHRGVVTAGTAAAQ